MSVVVLLIFKKSLNHLYIPLRSNPCQVLSWSTGVNTNSIATDGQGRQTAHIIHPMLVL